MYKARNSLRNQRRIFDSELRREVPKSTYYDRLRKKRRGMSETHEVPSVSTSSSSTSSSNGNSFLGNLSNLNNFEYLNDNHDLDNEYETPSEVDDVHSNLEMHELNNFYDNSIHWKCKVSAHICIYLYHRYMYLHIVSVCKYLYDICIVSIHIYI